MSNAPDDLFNRLSEALDMVDPVPDDAVVAAKEAFLTRNLDERFAALVMDSAAEFGALALRGETLRSLSFELSGRSIEIEIDAESGVLHGILAPSLPADVTLEVNGVKHASTTTDDFGRFRFTADVSGASIVVRVTVDGGDMICAFDI